MAGALLGRRRPPASLVAAALVAAAAAALPAAYLAVSVGREWDLAGAAIFDFQTLALLGRSAGLAAAVTIAATVIALPLAWLTVRSDLRGKRLWATLATLPLVIPSYIGAYLFVSALGPSGTLQDLLEPLGVERLPSLYGFPGAFAVLTLFTYPLALIPIRASLRRLDPQLEEAALAMGRRPREVFTSVVWPQLVPAVAGGALLVSLYVLSDFGAVSIMRFDSFTREIYISYQSGFERTTAAALGVVLVLVMLALLAAQSRLTRNRGLQRTGPGVQRQAHPVSLGRWRAPAIGFCGAIVALSLVLPVAVLVYWASKGISSGAAFDSVASYAGNSLAAAGIAAALAGLAALPIAFLSARYPGPLARLAERAGYAGYALPGIVVALALVFFATRVALPLYQTLAMLVFALAMHYLPLAIGPASAALGQLSPRVEEAARGLGRGPLEVFRTVTAPLVRGGILAGVALVFVYAIKELPATLLLAPTGFETLATDIWRQTGFGFYEASAIPALVLLAVSALPLYLLIDRGSVTP